MKTKKIIIRMEAKIRFKKIYKILMSELKTDFKLNFFIYKFGKIKILFIFMKYIIYILSPFCLMNFKFLRRNLLIV
jgi:hypothetical protein